MPQLDPSSYPSQIFWLVVTFAAMFLIMWRIAVPKIADVLEARQFRMDENRERAEELQKEAEAAFAAYEKALADARSEAHDEIARIQAELAEQAAKEEAEQTERLKARIAESEKAIKDALDEAMAGVRDVAIEVAQAAGEKVTGEAPDNAQIADAVDAALKR